MKLMHTIVPALAAAAFIVLARNYFGRPVDLVAWHPRTGRLAAWQENVPLLGGENVLRPRLCGNRPLVVHRTALQWLQAGRCGAVIIDQRGCADLLRQIGPLEVAEHDYARHLRRSLTVRPPRIFVTPETSSEARAA